MSCSRLTAKRYRERPGPPYHAGDCKGDTKKGNDGIQYTSVANSKGIYIWRKKGNTTTKKSTLKNRALEKFWQSLASGKTVVLVYKDGSQKVFKMPPLKSKKNRDAFDSFEKDTNIVAVITSAMSWDAYEMELYPKAKDKTVAEVLASWRKYFKPISVGSKMYVTY